MTWPWAVLGISTHATESRKARLAIEPRSRSEKLSMDRVVVRTGGTAILHTYTNSQWLQHCQWTWWWTVQDRGYNNIAHLQRQSMVLALLVDMVVNCSGQGVQQYYTLTESVAAALPVDRVANCSGQGVQQHCTLTETVSGCSTASGQGGELFRTGGTTLLHTYRDSQWLQHCQWTGWRTVQDRGYNSITHLQSQWLQHCQWTGWWTVQDRGYNNIAHLQRQSVAAALPVDRVVNCSGQGVQQYCTLTETVSGCSTASGQGGELFRTGGAGGLVVFVGVATLGTRLAFIWGVDERAGKTLSWGIKKSYILTKTHWVTNIYL